MEKAKLSITKAKSGKYIVNVILANNKTQPVPRFNPTTAELNGKEVEIERESGKIIKIIYEGKEIFSVSTGANPTLISTYNHTSNISDPAWAPYNFVPLNEKVVPAEKLPDFDRYHNDRYTGYIDLTIKTETPLYIRDTLTEEELKQGKEAKNVSDFFSPAGKIRIPGSSLRGMTRNLVEIMSFGKFWFFDDKKLYFRAVGDRSKLGSDYRSLMVDESNNYFPKIKAGILKKSGLKYVIYPSKTINGTQIYRVNFDKKTKIISGTKDFTVEPFNFKEVYFNPVSPTKHKHKTPKKDRTLELKYALLTSVSPTKDPEHPRRGFIIASGEFDTKHMHWVINEPESNCIEIKDSVIEEYMSDSLRDERADLLKKLKDHPHGVPCFYLTDYTNNIICFGHTGMFRLAYKKSIGDHIPANLKDSSTLDIAEAIFGTEKTFAGRVFFEDAFLVNPTGDDLEKEKITKILLGPKPTAFQHYLVQTNENLKDHPKNLAHYNSPNPIRGHKLYWHKSSSAAWAKENQNEFNPKIDTKIRPVKEGKTFTGRIRFENLSRVELGALLSALDLPNGCCHKIGMGKPLGLGSIKITPTLYLSNRKERYESLVAEWGGLPEFTKIKDFKDDFEKYVLDKIGEKTIKDLWQLDRMKELKRMLDFNNKPADNKTRYMLIKNARNENEFKERRVLPKPTEVK